MKYYDWNDEKNKLLKEHRNISFEEIILAIINNQLLDVVTHPNSDKYPDQKMLIVEVNNYAYLFPFVESEDSLFLKTIYPSRKATRDYLKKKE